MPLLNSMGIFRSMSILPSGASPYYFNALNLKGTGDYSLDKTKLTVINDKIYEYGFTSVIIGASYGNRPFLTEYDTDGSLKSYKVYADDLYYEVAGFCIDSGGNKTVLIGIRRNSPTRMKFRLLQYDSTDTLIATKEISATSGSTVNRCFGMVIDSSDNLYVGINNWGGGAIGGIGVLKFDSALNLTWTSQVNPSLQNVQDDNIFINIDSSSNIILTIKDHRTSPNNDLNYVVKMNSSGVVQWTRQIVSVDYTSGSTPTCQTIIDSSNNIFVLIGTYLVKILSNGTVSYKHTFGGTIYNRMSLNNLGNLVLMAIDESTVVAVEKDTVAPKSSVSVSTYYSTFNFQNLVSNSKYTFVNNYYYNGVDANTLSVIKIAANGYPPNLGAKVDFSQTNDDSITYTWNNTISISLDSNISITDATMTVNNITTTATSITTSITNVTQATGSTVPVVYATPLK